VDEILKGVGGLRVEEAHIRAATAKYTRDANKDVITEARRKFPKMDDTIEIIKGVKVPFTKEDLKKRLQRSNVVGFEESIEMLWQAGILGVEIAANDKSFQPLKALLPAHGQRFYKNVEGKVLHRWYYFEYNYEGDANEFFVRFESERNVDVQFVFHPTTFETLSGKVSLQNPIGI
jgi:hypothetical protein